MATVIIPGHGPAVPQDAPSPLSENADSRRTARTSVTAVTIAPITTAVTTPRCAFRLLSEAIELAMPSEYCSTDRIRAPLTKLPSSDSQTSRYSRPTAMARVVSTEIITNTAL